MTNEKTTKKALLTSCMSMLLCVSMLIGSTFAWFTDNVTSTNNIIKSGNLDIELDYWNGANWETVQEASDILSGNLWEPGYVDVAYLRLQNAGSLALKYQLGVNIVSETAGKNVAGEEFKLSDYIYFDVKENVNPENNAYATREAAMAVATETTKISRGYTKVSDMKANSEPLYLAMIVHMPETVGNEANHNGTDIPQIDLGINVVATQLANEKDSFGGDYDNLAFVPVADVDFLDNTNVTLVDGSAMDLDVAYSFKTTEDDMAAAAGGYRYWHADFAVSASKTVKANSMALAGYYDAYAQATNTVGKWIALESDEDIAKDTEIRLLKLMGVTGNYQELCNWIPEFLCGAVDLDGSNEGNSLKVELRLYETYSEEECLELFGYKSKNEETGKYITIGVFEHTFVGDYKEIADVASLETALENGEKVSLENDIEHLNEDTINIPAGVTTTLDLKGHTITANPQKQLINAGGNLTVKNGTIVLNAPADSASGSGVLAAQQGGTVTLENVTLKIEGGLTHGLLVQNGTINLNEGTEIIVSGSGYQTGILSMGNDVININGGNVTVNAPSDSTTSVGIGTYGTLTVNANSGKLSVSSGANHYGIAPYYGSIVVNLNSGYVVDVANGATGFEADVDVKNL